MTEGGRAVLALFVTAAAAADLYAGRIRNILVLPSMAGGLLLLAISAPGEIPSVLGAMLLTFLFLFPFWRGGGLGAGDIKFLMALAPFTGARWYFTTVVLSFLIGAAISAFLLIRDRGRTRTIHFAVPVGISVMLCLLLEQFGVRSISL